MHLRALLLIALLLPGCALSFPGGQVDQGQQQGLLEALQKLRLLNLPNGRHQNQRDTHARQAQQQQSQQVFGDIANASQNAAVFPDLDSLLRSRLKRDQSLMVQINVFNSAGKGCWHRRKASSPAVSTKPEVNAMETVAAVPPKLPASGSSASAKPPAPALGSASTLAYADIVTDNVPFIKSKAPFAGYSLDRVSPTEVVDANVTESIVVETAPARALGMESAPLQAQGEKDVIHNYAATPSEFAQPLQYSQEDNTTLNDLLFTATDATHSRSTPVDAVWKSASYVPFFPKQSFDDYRSKEGSKQHLSPLTMHFGPPAPVLKFTVPLLIPPEQRSDDVVQPKADIGIYLQKQVESFDLNDPSRCLQSLSLGLKCDESTQLYRAKASGTPDSSLNILSGNVPAAVGPRNIGRKSSGPVERCICSDTDLGDKEGFKLAGTQELLLKPRAENLERLRPQLQQKPPLKIFGSLRYPPPNDVVYEYATTYVYEDYFPTAYYENQPQPQETLPPQKPALGPSYQQPQPVPQLSLASLLRPEAARYESRTATNHPLGSLAAEHKARRFKAGTGTRITSGPRKRFARDLQAVQEPVMRCPCSSTRKPPCTKTPKKCVKKRPCTTKAKKCKKPCRKKPQEPNMQQFPVPPNMPPFPVPPNMPPFPVPPNMPPN
ncbi:uncharacterized protein LOC125946147 [Dermacentor silvarum]|uniref:uncharacterized protein LOC125946147 n=1 Tax=Dermacentor silvarum TaxID=543639 RepID=UPI0021007AB2|nr:uncharacterized protein LOC125946147 [Dermacentor silvarum]